MKTKQFLLQSGIYPNLLGFNYILRAVEIAKERGNTKIVNGIYDQIAKEYKTKKTCVERGIRTVIQHISPEMFEKVGVTIKLTNGQFIYFCAFMLED